MRVGVPLAAGVVGAEERRAREQEPGHDGAGPDVGREGPAEAEGHLRGARGVGGHVAGEQEVVVLVDDAAAAQVAEDGFAEREFVEVGAGA